MTWSRVLLLPSSQTEVKCILVSLNCLSTFIMHQLDCKGGDCSKLQIVLYFLSLILESTVNPVPLNPLWNVIYCSRWSHLEMRYFPEMQLHGIEEFLSPLGIMNICRASVVHCRAMPHFQGVKCPSGCCLIAELPSFDLLRAAWPERLH